MQKERVYRSQNMKNAVRNIMLDNDDDFCKIKFPSERLIISCKHNLKTERLKACILLKDSQLRRMIK